MTFPMDFQFTVNFPKSYAQLSANDRLDILKKLTGRTRSPKTVLNLCEKYSSKYHNILDLMHELSDDTTRLYNQISEGTNLQLTNNAIFTLMYDFAECDILPTSGYGCEIGLHYVKFDFVK